MSDTRVFTVPDLGEGLTDATLTAWFVVEGDIVILNQALCSLSTAKAEVEIPSPFAGRVGRLHGQVGDTIDVGAPLVDVEVPGEPPPAATESTQRPTDPEQGDGDPAPAVLVGYGTSAGPARRLRPRGQLRTEHAPTVHLESEQAATGQVAPYQTPPAQDWPVQTPPAQNPPSQNPPAQTPPVQRPTVALAKPPVRALAKRLGVDLQALAPGSGPDGTITRHDVEIAGNGRHGDPADVAAPSSPPGEPTSLATSDEDGVHVIAVRGVRAVIAQRMTTSRQTIPEAWCGRWVDATDLVARVDLLRSAGETAAAQALTPFSVILRYVVAALRRHPLLNATFDAPAAEIRTFDAVHLGVAVADDRGLVVPVVRHAQRLTTGEIALETKRLVAAVRQGKATPSELSGSTFTVSNFGALGLDDGNPIINSPEAAILGVGAIRPRPAVVGGQVVVRSTAKLTCAFDHRVCDGSDAGSFLADLARLIEGPDAAFLNL